MPERFPIKSIPRGQTNQEFGRLVLLQDQGRFYNFALLLSRSQLDIYQENKVDNCMKAKNRDVEVKMMDHETTCMALRLMPQLRLSAAQPGRDISFSLVLGRKRFRHYEVLQIFINEYRGKMTTGVYSNYDCDHGE